MPEDGGTAVGDEVPHVVAAGGSWHDTKVVGDRDGDQTVCGFIHAQLRLGSSLRERIPL